MEYGLSDGLVKAQPKRIRVSFYRCQMSQESTRGETGTGVQFTMRRRRRSMDLECYWRADLCSHHESSVSRVYSVQYHTGLSRSDQIIGRMIRLVDWDWHVFLRSSERYLERLD